MSRETEPPSCTIEDMYYCLDVTVQIYILEGLALERGRMADQSPDCFRIIGADSSHESVSWPTDRLGITFEHLNMEAQATVPRYELSEMVEQGKHSIRR